MSAGLAASTVTPGRTAPLISFTTPAMPVACANELAGTIADARTVTQNKRATRSIATSLLRLANDTLTPNNGNGIAIVKRLLPPGKSNPLSPEPDNHDPTLMALLIVEDESNIRELVRSHLESEGYECVSVADGCEALDHVKRQLFDVILLDLMLPGKDGLSLCRAIRNEGRNRDAPILMRTARREESDKIAGFDHGADDNLNKPFSMKVLSVIDCALKRHVRRLT